MSFSPRDIATRVIAMDLASRDEYIRLACGDDRELKQAVDQLLALQDSATIAQTSSKARTGLPVRPIRSADLCAGSVVDDFRIIKGLGRGAMGVVYLAEQQNPKRRVALKLHRSDTSTPERERRFEFESESLANLDHPCIATIYKSGSAMIAGTSRAFIAMELVDGDGLDRYCRRLALRERVRLMTLVCEAVSHAHLRGVVHRDLKPANIVVDIEGRPRVLDFGVAMRANAGEQSGEIVGTVPYMSPEQIDGKGNVDLRSDIYALGIVLHEILAEARPFETSNMTIDEVRELIRQPPSIGWKTIGSELGMIVCKAIAANRENRYESVEAMRADLCRYLDSRPVEAVRGGRMYVARKFTKRNRAAVSLAAIAILLAAGGFAGIVNQATRATRGWRAAQEQSDRAEAALIRTTEQRRMTDSVNRFMIEMLISADPESTLGERLTVVEMLDNASATLDSDINQQPEVAAGIRMALSSTYRSMGRLEDAKRHAEEMIRVCEDQLGPRHPLTSDARRSLALVLFDFGLYTEAKEQLDLAKPGVSEPADIAKLKSEYARVAHGAGDSATAFQLWTEAEHELADILGPDHKETLVAVHNRAMALKELGRLSESESVMFDLAGRRETSFGADHPQTLVALDSLAGIIQKQGREQEAAAILKDVVARRERVLGTDHISTMVSVGNLGATLIRLGEIDEAERMTHAAYEWHLNRFGESHTRTLILMGNLAYALEDQGRTQDAAAMYRRSIEVRKTSQGAMDPETWSTMNNLAMLLMKSGEYEEASVLFDELLALCDAALPADHYYTALFRNNQADCLIALGLFDDAKDSLDRSHPVIVATFGESHARTVKSRERYARLTGSVPKPTRPADR